MIQHIDELDSLHLRAGGGVYERFETAYVRRVLKPRSVFVDVGAHIGYYSALAVDVMDWTGKAYAFEPCPANFDLLKQNIGIYGDSVVIHDWAIGDKQGNRDLYLSEVNSGDHRLSPVADRAAVSVFMTTLDAALADVERIDFLKIDVQGSECRVLSGAREIIGRSPALRGIIEYSPVHLCQGGEKLKTFFDLFEQYGLRLYQRRDDAIMAADVPDLLTYHRKVNLFFSRGGIE
ncbi:MAG: FkbM family methyltransferase [Candidatus Omnitrophota bacterium]|nr:FkbM family methyltransferase [Sphaerochaeta sp.]